MSYNGTTEGAVATYQCDGGYSLSGNVERVCQSDGNWNGQVPQRVTILLLIHLTVYTCIRAPTSLNIDGEADNFIKFCTFPAAA